MKKITTFIVIIIYTVLVALLLIGLLGLPQNSEARGYQEATTATGTSITPLPQSVQCPDGSLTFGECPKEEMDLECDGYHEDREEYIQIRQDYAYRISGGDKLFVRTMNEENGSWNAHTRSRSGYWCKAFGKITYDYGFGISSCYHNEVTSTAEFKVPDSWEHGLNEAWKLYKDKTTFYGKDKARWTAGEFTCI